VRHPILIAALAFGVAGAASAQPAPAQAPPGAAAPRVANTQMFVSPMGEPFRAPDGPDPEATWFAQADTNHDGAVSRAEFRADAQRFFKLLDVNGDGKLNDMEMHRYEVEVAPEIIQTSVDTSLDKSTETDFKGDPVQQTLSSVRQGASFFGVIDDPEPVRSADGDFNMKVTLDEWLAAADHRFRLLAGDKDGIKLSDLPKTPFQVGYEKSHPAKR
jgi:hypothetical protein